MRQSNLVRDLVNNLTIRVTRMPFTPLRSVKATGALCVMDKLRLIVTVRDEKYYDFHYWLACGVGAASSAFFMFSLTLTDVYKIPHVVSIQSFLVSMVFSVSVCILSREIRERSRENDRTNNIVGWMSIFGGSFFSSGLVFMFISIGMPYLIATLGITVVVCILYSGKAIKSIKNP